MNYKLTIIFLFASLAAFSQNPISFTYLKPGGTPASYATPDTVTVSVKGTSGFWSTTVKQVATTTVKAYKAPVIVPPPVPNNAPIVNAGADVEVTLATGQTSITVQLAATVQDESPSTVTWVWSGLGLNATNISNPRATLSAPGIYSYPVTIKDEKGVAGSDAVNITVKAAPIVTPPPTGTVQPKVYQSFDNISAPAVKVNMPSDIGGYWETAQFAKASQMTKSTFAYKGSSLKVELNKNDPAVSNRVRAEITQGAIQTDLTTGYTVGRDDEWFGCMVYQDGLAPDNHPFSFLQWHQQASDGSPDLALWQRAGYLEMLHTTSSTIDGGWEQNPSRAGWYVRPTPNAVFPQKKWVAIVVHVKWAADNTGILEYWQEGVKVFERRNVITSYANQSHYLKLGLYCWKWPLNQDCTGAGMCDTRVVYYDEIRRWFGKSSENVNGYDVVNPLR